MLTTHSQDIINSRERFPAKEPPTESKPTSTELWKHLLVATLEIMIFLFGGDGLVSDVHRERTLIGDI